MLEDEHIFHGEETSRYEHCGFPIHLSYYITLSTVDFLFIFLIISLLMHFSGRCFHLLLGYIIALFSLSSSLGIHSKINLDMVRVMPPTMKPIDFNMKWVPTY